MSEPMTSVPVPAAMMSEEADLRIAIHGILMDEISIHDTKAGPRIGGDDFCDAVQRILEELFAPILAEKEREIADLGRLVDYDTKALADTRARALAAEAALAGERERCAKIVDEHARELMVYRDHHYVAKHLQSAAAAIRAQGE